MDILADGSLDYPDDLLAELDYTVCSIHSRFVLGKKEQTERIMRAMDNPYFNIWATRLDGSCSSAQVTEWIGRG